MKEKILPLCESPIKVYSNYAYILSVLLSNEEAKNWFYSNFIQVKYIRDTDNRQQFIFNYSIGNLTKYFYNIPYLEIRSMKREFMLKVCNNIIEFLCQAIEEGYYIMTIVDEYYLPPRMAYKNRHYKHLIMLYGYNSKRECFYSMGYNGGNYEESILNFEEMFTAITSDEGNNVEIRDDFCMLYRLQEKDKIKYRQENYNYFPYKLNLKLIRRSLKEYLDSKCSDEHFSAFYEIPHNSEYGILYYEAMIEYIENYIEGKYQGDVYAVAFHGMMEHKTVMVQRLRYLQEEGYVSGIVDVIDMYENLTAKAVIIRNLLLKYNIIKKKDLLIRVKAYLREMYILEKHAVKILLNVLDETLGEDKE